MVGYVLAVICLLAYGLAFALDRVAALVSEAVMCCLLNFGQLLFVSCHLLSSNCDQCI
jgi:hypothetical protein